MGRNSETAIMIEKFLRECEAPAVFTKDAADYITALPVPALERPNTTLVVSFSQLQRLAIAAKFDQALTFSMDILRLISWLHAFTERFAPHIVVKHLDHIFVAVHGEVSSTKLQKDLPIWREKAAAYSAVWWLQNTARPFEALSTAAYVAVYPTDVS